MQNGKKRKIFPETKKTPGKEAYIPFPGAYSTKVSRLNPIV